MYVVAARSKRGLSDLGFAWVAIPAIIEGVFALMKHIGSTTTNIDYGHMWPHFQAVGGWQWLDTQISGPVSAAWGVDRAQFNQQFQGHWPFSGQENPPTDVFFNAVGNLVAWAQSVGGHPDVGVLLDAFDNAEIMIETRWSIGIAHKTSYEKFASVKSEIMQQLGGSAGGGGGGTNAASFFSQIKPEYFVLGGLGLLLFMAASSKKKQRQPQIIYM